MPNPLILNGAGNRTRTDDLLITKYFLFLTYQLLPITLIIKDFPFKYSRTLPEFTYTI